MAQPNVIWIYCDELRTDALGCYGNPYAEMITPNIDAIAGSGVQFNNCFCNSPVCVASRASVLTGLYPEDTGVYHNEAAWPNYRFEQDLLTLPGVFAGHGYRTANFGKVHVPDRLQQWEHDDRSGGGMQEVMAQASSTDAITKIPGIPTVVGGSTNGKEPYAATAVTDNALSWFAANDQPFFARLSYLQPHTPVLAPPPYDVLYQDARFPDGIDASGRMSEFERAFAAVAEADRMTPEQIVHARVSYYGLVAWVDGQVGRILAYLREHDLLRQTIVVFDADHGASLGEQGRFQKQTFAPESHRVPRLISWPGTVPAAVDDGICESLDLANTLFYLANIERPAQFKGRNLLTEPAPEAVFGTIGYGFESSHTFPNARLGRWRDHGWPRRSCVRTQRYRLDCNVRMDGQPVASAEADVFLADVVDDPEERINLAGEPTLSAVVDQLKATLNAHVADAVEVPEAFTMRPGQN